MDLNDFKLTVKHDLPPADLSGTLKALWYDAKGDWDRAHKLAQEEPDSVGAWIHAYLHRVEGDESNAGYWYKKAARPHCTADLRKEWEEIVTALLTANV